MSNSLQTSQLFSPSPVTWGLRGDPSLWVELRDRLGEETWPPSVEALAELEHRCDERRRDAIARPARAQALLLLRVRHEPDLDQR